MVNLEHLGSNCQIQYALSDHTNKPYKANPLKPQNKKDQMIVRLLFNRSFYECTRDEMYSQWGEGGRGISLPWPLYVKESSTNFPLWNASKAKKDTMHTYFMRISCRIFKKCHIMAFFKFQDRAAKTPTPLPTRLSHSFSFVSPSSLWASPPAPYECPDINCEGHGSSLSPFHPIYLINNFAQT